MTDSSADSSAGPVLGYGTNGFADHTLADALDVIEESGYGAVALTLGHPHLDPFAHDWRERTLELREALALRGLRVVVETGARYLLDPRVKHAPTLVDEDAAARIAFLARSIEIAEILGADAVSLWSGILPAGTDADTGRRRLLDRLPALLVAAERHGIRLGFEPEPGMLIETVADALALRRLLGDPEAFGITVDLGHCVAVEPDGVVGALRAAGDLLVNVQVDDMVPGVHEHLPLGEGDLDLAAAFRTLGEIGYRGIAAIELPRHSHDAPRLAASSILAMRAALLDAGRTGAGSDSTDASVADGDRSDGSGDGPDAPLREPEHPWLAAARRSVESDASAAARLFPAAGREVGRNPIRPDDDPTGIVHGTVDDHARAGILVSAVAGLLRRSERDTTREGDDMSGGALPTEAAEFVERLYRTGDDAERRGVLAGLNALAARAGESAESAGRAGSAGSAVEDVRTPSDRLASPLPTALVDTGLGIVRDALRTNDPRILAAAMGRFAADHLDEHSWRHGVLKLVFTGVPLSAVVGLGDRRDSELARMAGSFASERRAAGRSVPDDVLDLFVAP